ncbi:MAG TPA: FUSC family protein [Burkholderiales bacterium]|nr:FUSC family protein [Burkholderiales bacterium]
MAETSWSRDLFKIAPGRVSIAVAACVAAATGIPLFIGLAAGRVVAGVIGAACGLLVTMADIGTTRAERVGSMAATALAMVAGGTIGAKFGGTTYADEAIVLGAAAVAGWVSGSHPAIATVARFCAIATAAGEALQFADPVVAMLAVGGGAFAILVTFVAWWLTGVPAADNVMDWRAGLRAALVGAHAGPQFAICYATACAFALFAAGQLGVARPYWATITVMMVMRREGLMSLELVIHYMLGTLAGILAAAAIEWAVQVPGPDGALRHRIRRRRAPRVRAQSGARLHRVHHLRHAGDRSRGAGRRPRCAPALHTPLRRGGRLRHRFGRHARDSLRERPPRGRGLKTPRRPPPSLSFALPTTPGTPP